MCLLEKKSTTMEKRKYDKISNVDEEASGGTRREDFDDIDGNRGSDQCSENDEKANGGKEDEIEHEFRENAKKSRLPLRKKQRVESIDSFRHDQDAAPGKLSREERSRSMYRNGSSPSPTTTSSSMPSRGPSLFQEHEENGHMQRKNAAEREKLSLIASLCGSSRGMKGQKSQQESITNECRKEELGLGSNSKQSENHEMGRMRNHALPPSAHGRPTNMGIGSSSPSRGPSFDIVRDKSLYIASTNAPAVRSVASASSAKKTYRFPVKLMRVLSSGKYDDVISWTPDGKAFVVHNQNELVKQVLPLNDFKGVKYSSFTRKLHRWGFVKILRGGSDSNNHRSAYFHKNFQRGNFALCHEMRCSGKGGDDDELFQQYNNTDEDATSRHHGRDGIPFSNELSRQGGLGSIHSFGQRVSALVAGDMAAAGSSSSSSSTLGGVGQHGQKRSLDDTLKILQAERELLLIEQQRKMLREEEERRMYTTSSPYGIAGLNYLSSLRSANTTDSLLLGGGGLPRPTSGLPIGLGGAFSSTNLQSAGRGRFEGAPSPSGALLALSAESARGGGGSLLGANVAQQRASQEELLLASRRGDLSSMIGLLPNDERSGGSLIPGYGNGFFSSPHPTTATSALHALPRVASGENRFDRAHLLQQWILHEQERGRGGEGVHDTPIREEMQKLSSMNKDDPLNDNASFLPNKQGNDKKNGNFLRSSHDRRESVEQEEMKSHSSYEIVE